MRQSRWRSLLSTSPRIVLKSTRTHTRALSHTQTHYLTYSQTIAPCTHQDLGCNTCLLSTWGVVGSATYSAQYNIMAATFQAAIYTALSLGSIGGNVTVTGFTQKSSRRQLLTPALTAAYTGMTVTVLISDYDILFLFLNSLSNLPISPPFTRIHPLIRSPTLHPSTPPSARQQPQSDRR